MGLAVPARAAAPSTDHRWTARPILRTEKSNASGTARQRPANRRRPTLGRVTMDAVALFVLALVFLTDR